MRLLPAVSPLYDLTVDGTLNHSLMEVGRLSDGAGYLLELERPTNLDDSRAMACFACSMCGLRCLDFFLFYQFSFSFPTLRETARYRLKYCFKGPLNLQK